MKTDAARGYLVARIRWHLGDRKAFPTRPAAVRSADAVIIEAKAKAAIEAHHHLLPPVVNP